MSPFGLILAATDELCRKAAVLPSASAADLYVISTRLAEASRKVRVMAECRAAEAAPPRIRSSSLRSAA